MERVSSVVLGGGKERFWAGERRNKGEGGGIQIYLRSRFLGECFPGHEDGGDGK